MTKKKGKTILTLRIERSDLAKWKASAKKNGLNLTEYIRRRVNQRPLTAVKLPYERPEPVLPQEPEKPVLSWQEIAAINEKERTEANRCSEDLEKAAAASWISAFGAADTRNGNLEEWRPKIEQEQRAMTLLERQKLADLMPARELSNGMIID